MNVEGRVRVYLARYYLWGIVLLAGCTGSVRSPNVTVISSIQSMLQQNSVTLISNATQTQNLCANSNSVVIQVALSSTTPFYCRDQSTLMDSVRLGPVCAGGVTIAPLTVDSQARSCSAPTLCGQAPTSSVNVAQRLDGTYVKQLTFSNLPWGCQGLIEASTDPSFPAGSTQTVTMQVLPPTCPYCSTSGSLTCNTCAAHGPNTQVVAGQVIPITCSPGPCAPCAYMGGTIPHGGTQPFYATSSVGCGQTCNATAQTVVCNNGSWVPNSYAAYSQTCREPPAASCPPPTVVQSAMRTLSSAVSSVKAAVNRSPIVLASTVATCASCQAGGCAACTTAGGTPGYLLYSQTTVPVGSTCSAYSQCEACAGGLFQGDPTYRYGSCTALSLPCTASSLGSSVGSGLTQNFFSNTPSGCTQVTLRCANGAWQTTAGIAVPQNTVDAYAQACAAPTDCVTQGGVTIRNGQSTYVFTNSTVPSTTSCYASGNYASLNCVSGTVAPSDPGPTFRYSSCAMATCLDPTDSAGTRKLTAGTTTSKYSIASADCSQTDPLAYCNANKVTITCGTNGGTATILPVTAVPTTFTNSSCTVPASCQQCSVTTTDTGLVQVGLNASVNLYAAASAQSCGSISATFTCTPGISGGVPTLVGSNGALRANYPFLVCASEGDEGTGGGTGGGTGNDSGPGAALKQRFGSGDGSGGPGGPCIDATTCQYKSSWANMPIAVRFKPCQLPWGKAEMEFYGSIIAFGGPGTVLAQGSSDTICVVKPDKCSNHRQSRTCHYPAWTGVSTYAYPNCIEKASCP